jgi:hypothetical protein
MEVGKASNQNLAKQIAAFFVFHEVNYYVGL